MPTEETVTPQGSELEGLTPGDRVVNALIGAGIGLAIGGASVATAGAVGTVGAGSGSTFIQIFGATGAQTFAYGALSYNTTAMVMAPFFSVEMEPIEYGP